MELDQDLLDRFEAVLNPRQVDSSSVPAIIIGFGEISAIFQIDGDASVAYKRLPLFPSRKWGVLFGVRDGRRKHLCCQSTLPVHPPASFVSEHSGCDLKQTYPVSEAFGSDFAHERAWDVHFGSFRPNTPTGQAR